MIRYKLVIESSTSEIFLREWGKRFYCPRFHFYEERKRTKKEIFTSMDSEAGKLKHVIYWNLIIV